MEPKDILDQVRKFIEKYAGNDPDKWWYVNRYVFDRLMLDEGRTKAGVKKRLFDSSPCCHYCHEPFESIKGVYIHRVNDGRGYSDENCVLMHGKCHEQYHSENFEKETPRNKKEEKMVANGQTVLITRSKFYDDMPFTYWWDISPQRAENLDRYDAMEFICKDTGSSCRIAVPDLKQFLTKQRQTSRGRAHWGVRVLNGHEDELAFEPGTGIDGGKWEFLPVTWITCEDSG